MGYAFGPFSLDPARRRLLRDGKPIALPPRVLDLLIVLLERAGTTVSRRELMSTLWGRASEASLTQHIFMLRRTLGGDAASDDYVATVPKIGYCFVAHVQRSRGTESSTVTASQLCRNAEDFWQRRTETAIRSGIALYERALELEPENADAHAGIAMCLGLIADYFYADPKPALEACQRSAKRALSIDPHCARALIALGKFTLDYHRDFARAGELVASGLLQSPRDSIGLFLSTWIPVLAGRFGEASTFLERRLQENPDNVMLEQLRGVISLYSGRYERAIRELRASLARTPYLWLSSVALGQALFLSGDTVGGIEQFERVWRAEDDPFMYDQIPVRFFAAGYLIYALFRIEENRRAQELWDRMKRIASTRYVPRMLHAIAAAGCRRFDEARSWLAESAELRECWYAQVEVEPFLVDLRDEVV